MSDDLVRYRQEEVHLGGGDVEIRYVESKDGWIASYADAKAALDAKDAEIARLRDDLATERSSDMGPAWVDQMIKWKAAIEDALLAWCSAPYDDETPEEALRRLINYEVETALDPAVSQDAADLVATARRKGMEDAAKRLQELHKNHKYDPLSGTLIDKLGKYDGWPESAKTAMLEHQSGYYRALAEGVAHILRAAEKEGKP